jgi:hypothetical protein
MSKKGAQLVAEGVYITHVIEQVKNSGMPSADGTVQNLSSDRMAPTEEQ